MNRLVSDQVATERHSLTAAIEAAADTLAAGGLVAFPTETVYGLGARADDDAAVAAIFAAKGRPADHPLIVHVQAIDAARRHADVLPQVALRLMAAFWPGPLTLVVPRASGIAGAAAAGQPSIALRSPAHPVAQALLAAAAMRGVHGVAAPSANRYGRISPTTADHVRREFGDASRSGRGEVPAPRFPPPGRPIPHAGRIVVQVLDGGTCDVGIESAIVDCTRGEPVLLRPGVLWPSRIEAAAGCRLRGRGADAPRVPGDRAAHYAPDASLTLVPPDRLDQALADHLRQRHSAATIAVYSRARPSIVDERDDGRVLHRAMPNSPLQAAGELYGALRDFDLAGVDTIWVESPPAGQEWDGVRDRLQRAAASR